MSAFLNNTKVKSKLICYLVNNFIMQSTITIRKQKWNTLTNTFTHSFIPPHCHVQNATIPCRSQELLPLCYVLFPATLLHQLFFHPLSPHLAIYFLVYLSVLLFPNSYIIPFWEFYFLPLSVHAQTNIIYLTLLSLLYSFILLIN